jgi:hypothetical protein
MLAHFVEKPNAVSAGDAGGFSDRLGDQAFVVVGKRLGPDARFLRRTMTRLSRRREYSPQPPSPDAPPFKVRRSGVSFAPGLIAEGSQEESQMAEVDPEKMLWLRRGLVYAQTLNAPVGDGVPPDASNELRRYFNSVQKGPGIWKWDHYFDIYDRHLAKFRGTEMSLLEVGVYSGGSLGMWKAYFGTGCRVYGVDVEEACAAYEDESVEIFIGDQVDRDFWTRLKGQLPPVDVVIDDGGHAPEQQLATLEEMLPHLRPGGVYICEDIHGSLNDFACYVNGIWHELNAGTFTGDVEDNERRLVCETSALQSVVHSIHLYPFLAVIERRAAPVTELVAPKRGTQWQPFLR